MEDNLNFFENGRQPHFFGKWKTTSIFFNGRRPKHFCNKPTTTICIQTEDDLNNIVDGRRPLQIT